MNTHENGILSISAEQYHASDAVSNSRLKDIAHPNRPAHYYAKWVKKDPACADASTPAKEFGSLLHRCLLEPDTMQNAVWVKPEGMKFTTKEGKEWLAFHSDRPIISADDVAMMEAMSWSLRNHPLTAKILRHCDKERSLFAEEKGLRLKSRMDLIPQSSGWNSLYDLKTIEHADQDSAQDSAWKFGYYRQAAFYLKMAKLVGLPQTTFTFIFVEKRAPYLVHLLEINPSYLEAANMVIERDLFLLRQCMEKNEWPGYPLTIGDLSAPPWAQKQLKQITA